MRRVGRIPFRLFIVCCVVALAGTLTATASASQLIDRNALHVRLAVNKAGIAMLTYSKRGEGRRVYHVLARGAIKLEFDLLGAPYWRACVDRAGGWGVVHPSALAPLGVGAHC